MVEQTSPTNALQVTGLTRKPVWGQKLAQICCYLFSNQAFLQGEFPLGTCDWLSGVVGQSRGEDFPQQEENAPW